MSHPEPAHREPPLRVLIIEDNWDAASSLRLFLRLSGYTVQLATTGPEGIQLALSWHPDIVLCDIGLPGCSGWVVARELRRNSETVHARLIAITGYDTEADQRRSAEVGFEAHLCKPYDPDVLLDLLAHQPAGS
jgi:CheY-like chemotaxis protein